MALRDYLHYFQRPSPIEPETLTSPADILDWCSRPYHARFLAWLDAEASRKITIDSNHLAVIESAVRANTLREIRQHLLRLAKGAAARAEEQNG